MAKHPRKKLPWLTDDELCEEFGDRWFRSTNLCLTEFVNTGHITNAHRRKIIMIANLWLLQKKIDSYSVVDVRDDTMGSLEWRIVRKKELGDFLLELSKRN